MKLKLLSLLVIGLLLLTVVQVNAHDVTSDDADIFASHTISESASSIASIGSCDASYGCSVVDMAAPTTETLDHDDLLTELANSLGSDD